MSIKAILVGTAFIFIISFLASVVVQLVGVLFFHAPPSNFAFDRPSDADLALNLVLDLACVFGGSYVAGRIGRRDPVLNALLTGAVELLLWVPVLFLITAFLPLPWWYTTGSLLLVVPAAYAGGLKASRFALAPTPRRR